MFKNFLIFTFIFIFIYLIFSYRYHIRYYIRYLKSDFKYKKDVRNNLKVDLKTRLLDDDSIDSAINFLDINLKKIGYVKKGEFIIPEALKRKILYSKYSEKSIKELFTLITNHMGIDDKGVLFEIKNVSSKIEGIYAGLYSEGNEYVNNKISLFIKPDYSYETVVSILIHESTHYFLLSNGIKLKERNSNEYLTDIATIYLGFGKYIVEGYKQKKKIVYLSEFNRTVSGYKVGYINYSDVKYAIKKIKKNNKL